MSSRVSRKAKFMSIFFSDKSRELRNIIGETVIIAVAISGLSLAETAIVSVQRLLLLRSLAGIFIATAATCCTDCRCSLAVGRAVVLIPTPAMPSPVRVELNI